MHKPQKFLLFISVGVLSLAMAACASSGKSATVVKNGYMNTTPPVGIAPPPSDTTVTTGDSSSSEGTVFVVMCPAKTFTGNFTGREEIKKGNVQAAEDKAKSDAEARCAKQPKPCDKGCRETSHTHTSKVVKTWTGPCKSDPKKNCRFVEISCDAERKCTDASGAGPVHG